MTARLKRALQALRRFMRCAYPGGEHNPSLTPDQGAKLARARERWESLVDALDPQERRTHDAEWRALHLRLGFTADQCDD